MSDFTNDRAELRAALQRAFPDRWQISLAELVAFLIGPSPGAQAFQCFLCRINNGVVGVTSGANPFFGARGGWDEAGGVRWICESCLQRAMNRERGTAVDADAALADATRALGEDSLLLAKLRSGHARTARFDTCDAACAVCGFQGRVHGFEAASLCGPCVRAGLRARDGEAGSRDR